MGTMSTSSTLPVPQEASNFDEVSMQQSLLFSDSLMDLKNLSTQLYSAAEYFELSYTIDDHKQIVIETLKDYATKAIVNTVDHLGSVTYKVDDLLDEKVDEVSGTELRVSCIEQRLRTCQEYIDHGGLSQQSLAINTPKYHKQYILPVGETMHGANRIKSKYQGCSLVDENERHQFRNAVQSTIRETPTSTSSRGHRHSRSPSPHPSQRSAIFSFTASLPKKELEKRTVSPHRFPLSRSGSLSSRSVTPNSRRPTTPNSSRPTTPNPNARRRYPSEPRKSASMRLPAERENGKEVEQYPSKSKRLLKALLSRRKSKKDDMLYTYLDEY
ncbi:protein ABIL2-like isoform X1 [Juglans microcarpa x Juglans regia]|uniref:protein ABIL2-like isoform X1 n=1 Tax=Juglans microcarpa x Juglans regia TaxID=2249226 RepID=UPI001B7F453C|nr:protein ABIL2-like isoform X1 [Juglans microcarpa x Juglans regia]XP_041009810.1 protein ABIL2-like isoform X1 [Juglans microcarpa x Juglans regia]XP_041009811.1 protein ABIL2-like isoform X1 [Juglans microcarpa x Juglans regia]XP_041009812.1 protein ABIL2-like isoform X1 [Juglans microcarpa x Juglans regia]XP_041009814.1 protein ABIL2-like isoform X1 [Juglans microcarpa x Juglans regia]XP_041009816.1 protein ABIL2-like isoform X1 [Juglans microcarpa x Juglans regia]